MRYYDPIIAIVQENISDDKRENCSLKQEVAYQLHREGDTKL